MPGYSSYDVVGKREDVSDVISNIAPTKVPFTSMTGGPESVHNTLFEWQEDDLRSAADNFQVEGFTANPTARTPTTKRQNYTQILQDTYQVTGSVEAVSTYGRAKESAYQAAKTMAALKRDLERHFVGVHQASAAGDNGTPRKFASYAKQLVATSGSASGQWIKTGNANTKPSEQNILDVLTQLYNDGAEPNTIMVTPVNSLQIASFAKVANTQVRVLDNANDGARKLVNVIDVYVSPFGQQKIVLNRFLKDKNTLIFDPANWMKIVLQGRNWFKETLAKVGDNQSYMVVGEFSLKHKNFKASGLITEEA